MSTITAIMNRTEPPLYLINQTGYSGIYPPFHNTDEFPWIKEIEQHWEAIRDELYAQGVFATMDAPHVEGESGWKGIYLINFSWIKHDTCRKFPQTMKVLKHVPNLTFAAFSMLEAGASLAPHWGDTNTIARCALGLEVPAPAPVCALQVADQVKSWEEGKIIMFSECHLHTAWNHSNKRRLIFTFDTMRPEFAASGNVICARVLAAESLFFLTTRFKWFSSLTKYLYKPLYWLAAAAWYIYLPFQRKFSFLP
jgi:aspartyl/asparaginyl beta-hydroxylase (cupin superfamily)